MSEDRPAEDEIVIEKRKPEETGARWLDIGGGVLGLIVFVIGVVLVVTVFFKASDMYQQIGPEIQAARAGSGEIADPGDGSPVTARPGGTPLTKILAEFGVRFVWLLLIALLGCLIAGLGAKLAGAHRGKRT